MLMHPFFSFLILSSTDHYHYHVISCHYHCNSLSVIYTTVVNTPLWEFVWIERFFHLEKKILLTYTTISLSLIDFSVLMQSSITNHFRHNRFAAGV